MGLDNLISELERPTEMRVSKRQIYYLLHIFYKSKHWRHCDNRWLR